MAIERYRFAVGYGLIISTMATAGVFIELFYGLNWFTPILELMSIFLLPYYISRLYGFKIGAITSWLCVSLGLILSNYLDKNFNPERISETGNILFFFYIITLVIGLIIAYKKTYIVKANKIRNA